MSATTSINRARAAYADQPQHTAPPPKPAKRPPGQDSVQLSQTAQAALKRGDADHDGDSH